MIKKNRILRTPLWIVFAFFIICAFALNLFLQLDFGINVIGGSNAPIVWLQFWASYLAAIAAFCVIFQNEKFKAIDKHEKYKAKMVEYIIRQAKNNPFIQLLEIHEEISLFLNPINCNIYNHDRFSPQKEQFKIQLDKLAAQIHVLEIELLSVFPKDKGSYDSENATEYVTICHTFFSSICSTIRNIKTRISSEQYGKTYDEIQKLNEQNEQLNDITKRFFDEYHRK